MRPRFLPLVIATVLAPAARAQQRPDGARVDSGRARRLAPVVVSGARLGPLVDRRLPGHPEALDLSRAAPGAAATAELLRALPGVSLTNDQGSRAQPTLELRGFTLSPVVGVSQGVSVFLDGVRVNEPDAQEVNFDLLPMEAIEHADLLPGASAIYGKNSLAGSLVLRTARGDTVPVVRDGLAIGVFGERDAHLLASGLRAGIDGLIMAAATTDDGYQAQSGASTRQLFATVGHRAVAGDLAFSLLVARNRLLEAGSLPERWLPAGRRANYTGGDFFHPELIQASVRGERLLGRLALRGNVFGRRNRIEQLNVNASDASTHAFVDNRSAGVTGEPTAEMRVGARPLTLSAGAELSRSTIEYRVLAEPHPDAPAPPLDCATTGDGTSALCEDARSAGDDAGLYVQAMLQATNRLSVVASLRGDRARVPLEDRLDPSNDGANGFQRLSPRVGVTWMTDAVRLYASAGSAFRAPAPLELACASADATCPLPFSLGADPPLAPVVAWNYEVGGSWSAPSSSTLALSLFHTDVRDEILFVSAQRAAGYFRSVDRTRRDGLEGSLRLAYPVEGLRLVGSYAFVDADLSARAVSSSWFRGE
jgi:iron complex outermembrane receptor protein